MIEISPHSGPVEAFDVVDNCLCVGGEKVSALAEKIGGTPFYAYDRRLIRQRIELLRDTLGANARLHYAIKANPMPALVQHMAGAVDGLDVASGGELLVALDTTMPASRISFAGPGKTEAELRQALAAEVTVNVESPGELETLARLGEQIALRPRVAIRVNPDFELRASGMRMGGGARQFGVDAEEVPALLEAVKRLDLDFQRFHIFTGSQNLNAEAICEAQRQSVDLALRLAEDAPGPVHLLNIGGGLGIPYFPQDKPLDLAAVGANLAALVPEIEQQLPEARIVVELGRYLVGEAGLYVCRVIDRKVSRGQVFLVTDGGLHHHLAASGNFGQVVRRNYPVAIGNRIGGGEPEKVSVVGCLCTPLDLLADGVELPKAEVGDLVVIFQSGAYGLSASPTAFLGHPKPLEVLL